MLKGENWSLKWTQETKLQVSKPLNFSYFNLERLFAFLSLQSLFSLAYFRFKFWTSKPKLVISGISIHSKGDISGKWDQFWTEARTYRISEDQIHSLFEIFLERIMSRIPTVKLKIPGKAFLIKNDNLNVTEVRDSDFKNAFLDLEYSVRLSLFWTF